MSLTGDTGLLGRGLYSFCELNESIQYTSLVLISIFSALFTWRMWRFTISPSFQLNEPPELPYWVPVIGHAVWYFKDQEGLLEYASSYFGKTGLPFSIIVAGVRLYFQTSLADISATYKNNTSLSFEQTCKEIMTTWGITVDGNEKMWRRGYDGIYPNAQDKSLGQLFNVVCKAQMSPGKGLDDLTEKFQELVEDALQPKKFPDECVLDKSGDGEITVSLSTLCCQMLVNVGTRTFFGDKLQELRPDLDQQFLLFDTDSWKLLFQLPPAVAKQMHDSKKILVDTLSDFYKLPASEKHDSSWLVQTEETEMGVLDMQASDAGLVLFMLYWLANVNTYKSSFWIMAYILSDPNLLSALKEETAGAYDIRTGNITSVSYLLDSCPRLNAVFDEITRVTNSCTSARSVVTDTVLNGYKYRAGSKILIPYRQLHFDEGIFGNSPFEFDAERFLPSSSSKTTYTRSTNPQFKPFGGGTTICTGRFIARREVLLFAALMIQRFEMSLPRQRIGKPSAKNVDGSSSSRAILEDLDREQSFPRLDTLKPGLGILEPVAGDDLVVRLRSTGKDGAVVAKK